MTTRRAFLEGIAAAGLATITRAEQAALGAPKLRLGVLSDIHIRGPETLPPLVKAFTWFNQQGVDGVVIAGDMADQGLIPQLQLVADTWNQVFPGGKGFDGRKVEKLFVFGNHDWEGFKYGHKPEKQQEWDPIKLCHDWPGNWERIFGEPFAPVYAKEVKGYTFIGLHWGKRGELQKFVDTTCPKLDPDKPFFFAQHAHPLNTVQGSWAWGAWDDAGVATKAFSAYPNAVAFSGHSHYSLTDERSIWQGAFTSIGTASLSYIGLQWGRENSGTHWKNKRTWQMPHLKCGHGKQGQLVSVYDDSMVIEKRDFVNDEPLGENWIVPLPCRTQKNKPFVFATRAKECKAPEFAADAKAVVTQGKGKRRHGKEDIDQVTVSFPAPPIHDWRDRVYEYEVQAHLTDCDLTLPVATKRVLAVDFFLSAKRVAKEGNCVFALSELPKGVPVHFTVTPLHCYGLAGKPLTTEAQRFS